MWRLSADRPMYCHYAFLSEGVDMTSPLPAPRAVMVWLLLAVSVSAEQHDHGATAAEKLGTVQFATSCSAAAQPLFNRAVALLHSFEFAHAVQGFTATLKTDPA